MRVTKLIKEYVEKSVNDVYKEKLNDCEKEYRIAKNKIEDELQLLVDEMDKKAKKIIEKNGLSIDIDDWNGKEERIIDYYRNFGSDEWHKVSIERNKIQDEKKEKIDEILLNLELGGTKKELDEMLQKIKEEVAE